ncbi:hypothetical protein BDZ91DRAFT_685856 [Kalaharituber pfeilii]|nr:hypothetical protein BDZ91DRAFT_685856 [Kalaharituber pfeilii]
MIDRIRSLNCFGCSCLSSEHLPPREPTNPVQPKDDKFKDAGLWILPSFINHSCWGNVQRSFIGDVMIVRACMPIAAGEQITFSYAPLLSDNNSLLEERQKRLRRGWGFTCNCRYCTLERNERKATRNEREKLLQDVEKLYRDAPAASSSKVRILLAALDAKIKAIEKTYSSSCPPAAVFPRIHLAGAVNQKQSLYARYNSWDRTRLACEGVLKALGYEIDTSNNDVKITKYGYSQPLVLLAMWQLYICRKVDALHMGVPLNGKVVVERVDTGGKGRAMDKLAEGWRRAAETMYEVCAGEKTTFEKVYALEKFIVI